MGFRFRKSKQLLPGVQATVSKNGVRVRLGGKHAGVSVGSSGVRASASIPGTGISYSKKLAGNSSKSKGKKESYDVSQFKRQLQIFDESVKLFMTTENPDTFFGRYQTAEQATDIMAELTDKPVCHDEPPQNAVEMLINDKTAATNAFLDRYANKVKLAAHQLTRGKKKKIESFNLVTSKYEDKMTAESILYRDTLYADMIAEIEQ